MVGGMSLDYRTVPIERWPGPLTEERKSHPFRTSSTSSWGNRYTRSGVNWSDTLDLLDREIRMLDGENVLLQMAIPRDQIRKDGRPYARAKPEHPGVIVSFDSRHGPLSYPCDTFDDWQANVRAVAKALESLRRVDRYGVSKRGEQYRGFAQLPPAGGSTSTMPARAAASVLVEATMEEVGESEENVLTDAGVFRALYRDAARVTHPDAPGGSTRRFQIVQEAKAVLERHHGNGKR